MLRTLTTALTMLLLPSTTFALTAAQVPTDPCYEAIVGSILHFSIGDGLPLGCAVEYFGGDAEGGAPPAGAIQCQVPNSGTVRCDLYGEYCSYNTQESPYNAPGVAVCFEGCGARPGAPVRMTINEAKCCLITGSRTGVNCNS